MADTTDATTACHWIAIDVARYWNAVLIETAAGQHHRFRMANTAEDHDRLIAYVLGLSHARNIAFFTALADSGEAAPKFARLSSTTFDSQLEVAGLVAEGCAVVEQWAFGP